jgi:hypothetical protein
MPAGTDPPDFGERQLRDWILCLLRFAVTQLPDDQTAALALACELDMQDGPGGPTFFQRTSVDVCRAIVVRDEGAKLILRQHISRIDEPRLRNAFAAAVGFDAMALGHNRKKAERKFRPPLLWRGLP